MNLIILLDGHPIARDCRVRVNGTETLSLIPDLLILELWNLSDSTVNQLRGGGALQIANERDMLSGQPGESLLAWGSVAEAVTVPVPDGTLTSVSFSPGLPLWESAVSMTVPAGITVSETVRRILAASGSGVSLLGYSGPDPSFPRPQSFYGRAAEAAATALSACDGRAFLTPAGLSVVPPAAGSDALTVPPSALLAPPSLTRKGWIFRTAPPGYPVGQRVRQKISGRIFSGLIVRRRIEAASAEDLWYIEMEVEGE